MAGSSTIFDVVGAIPEATGSSVLVDTVGAIPTATGSAALYDEAFTEKFMGIRAKQLTTDTFTSTEVTRVFAAGSISSTELATDSVTSDEIAAGAVTEAELNASVAGNGITGGGGTALTVDPDSETGGNTEPVTVTANGVGLDVNSIAGTGIEADGAANLRLATQGVGIAGGGGTVLSFDTAANLTITGIHSHTPDTLQVTGTPDTANDAVNKAYVDNTATGLQWLAPVYVKELIGSDAALDIEGLTPTAGDAYVVDTANGAGALSTATVGDIWEYDGATWNLIIAGVGGFVADGIRALASIQTALNGTIGLVDGTDDGKVLEWDGTSLTPTEVTPVAGDAVLVTDQDNDGDSIFANLGYTLQGTIGVDAVWTQFTGAGQINAGAGLTKTGNTLDVGAGTGITVAADTISFDATAADGNGLTGSGSVLTVDPDSETGGNTQPVSVTVNGVGLDVSAIAGTGLEADGAANLRIASTAAGAGLTGGSGSALAVGAGNAITVNADTIDVNPAGLIQGGAAEVDGDFIDIDYAPTSYTEQTGTQGGVTGVLADHLTAHLAGIDVALAGVAGTQRQEELTTQVITGTDTALTDTLNFTPVSNESVKLYLNGILQQQGAGNDYTISGSTITWLASSGTAVDMDTADILIAVYVS